MDSMAEIIKDYISLRDSVQRLMSEMQDEAADTKDEYFAAILNEWIFDLTAAMETQ